MANLTPEQLENLRAYHNANDYIGYYSQLDVYGFPYGGLALGVAAANTGFGNVARRFAENVGRVQNPPVILTGDQWATISLRLMQADFTLRSDLVHNGADLNVREIRRYHTNVFNSVGLPPEAWTAYVPTVLAGPAKEDAVWQQMLSAHDTLEELWLATELGYDYAVSELTESDYERLRDIWYDAMTGWGDGQSFWGAYVGYLGNNSYPKPFNIRGPGGGYISGGSDGGEILVSATRDHDVMLAYGGNDTAYGNQGDDIIYGLAGDDLLDGGEGKDILIGGTGSDILRGSAEGDVLIGGSRDGMDEAKITHVYLPGDAWLRAGGGVLPEDDITIVDTADYALLTEGVIAVISKDEETSITKHNISQGDRLYGIESIIFTPYADEIVSYGRDDDIQLGIDGVPDGVGDVVRIVIGAETRSSRVLHQPDISDVLFWDDLPLQGMAEEISVGGYRLEVRQGAINRVFNLQLNGTVLTIAPEGIPEINISIHDFYEGALGIYLDSRSTECSAEINTIIGKTDGVPIEGTCGPDEVKADEIEVGEDEQFNLDDNIKTYAGDDIIIADVNGPLSASRNVVDAGPGDDEVRGSVNYGSDTFYGGPGDDTLIGYQGNDSLYGGEGNDRLVTSGVYSEPFEGYSQLFGGAGNDDLLAAANAYLDGGPGDDELRSGDQSILLGGDGNDFLGTSGRVTSDGGPGNDRLSYSRGSPNAQSILTGGPGDDTFYFYNYDNQGNRISVDGGPGKNEYHFQKVEDINNIRFNGGDTEGRLFYEAFDSFGQLVWTPFWNTHQYEAVYNDSTSELSVNVMSRASGAVVAGDSSLQSTVIFTVEHFYNGMLGITGVEGAPDLPTEVVTPTVPITNPIYLPLIQEQAQSQSQTDQAVTAMVGEPLPYEPIILATSGILPMVVYGGRVLTGALPPKSVRTIHSAIHSLQTEIDVARIRAERLRKHTRQWLQHTLGNGRNAA